MDSSSVDPVRPRIALVDDTKANLTMGREMLRDSYEVFPVPSAAKLFELLDRVRPSLILLDVMMPEMDGYEAIRILKADPRHSEIPVIFLTARTDEGSELEGLALGAIDYVYKPFSAPLLLQRIRNHLLIDSQRRTLRLFNENLKDMVEAKTSEVVSLQNGILTTLAEMVEFRDHLTGGHVTRTKRYLEILVARMMEDGVYLEEIGDWSLEFVLPSAQLHDVGKIAISDAILNKAGSLDAKELVSMRRHVEFGVKVIERMASLTPEHAFLDHAAAFAGTHHERWDGTGYPHGLKELDIPLEGRLMAIADVYDSLISRRPYKEPMSPEMAVKAMVEASGSHFDPKLVEVFLKVADQFAEIAKFQTDHMSFS